MITWMQTHRKYLVPTIWISTIAFVGAGFVGWGAYDYGNNKSDTVAQVGERSISVNELQNTYSNVFSYYNQLFAGKLTQEKAEQLHLQDIALEKLTNEALLLNYADELGIKALDDEIISEYTAIKAFQENGVFNVSQYEKVLRGQGLNQKTFEQELEKGIILKKLRTALNLPLTPLEEEASFSGANLSDHLLIKTITQNMDDIHLDEKALKSSWESHKNQYMSPISYLLETIKVSTEGIDASEEEIKAFYEEKKFKFKDTEGKILPLDDAKDDVKTAVQLKKAKTAILKKYLAFKKHEISSDEELLVDASTQAFPFETLKDMQEGAYIKAIALKDGYMTARVKSVNLPAPLSYEKAKDKVESALRQEKASALLQAQAQKESNAGFEEGNDLGFVTVNDAQKITVMPQDEASQLLRHVFSTNNKSGYYISGNSAILYKIVSQKLFDEENFSKEKATISKDLSKLKDSVLENGLIKELKKRYTIQSFMKKEG